MINTPFALEMTSAMSIAPSTGAGKMMGASSIAIGPNTQQTMIARYSENSTDQNPIVTVTLGDYGSFAISVKDVDIVMKNEVTNEYSYRERSEQVKLRGFFEKQHKEIEIRKMLSMASG